MREGEEEGDEEGETGEIGRERNRGGETELKREIERKRKGETERER